MSTSKDNGYSLLDLYNTLKSHQLRMHESKSILKSSSKNEDSRVHSDNNYGYSMTELYDSIKYHQSRLDLYDTFKSHQLRMHESKSYLKSSSKNEGSRVHSDNNYGYSLSELYDSIKYHQSRLNIVGASKSNLKSSKNDESSQYVFSDSDLDECMISWEEDFSGRQKIIDRVLATKGNDSEDYGISGKSS